MKREFSKSVGRGMALVTVLCLSLLCSTPAFARTWHLFAAENATAPLKLAIAGGDHYSTDIGVSALSDATAPVDLHVSSCQQGGISLVPGGSFYFEDVTSTLFCGGTGSYFLVDQPAGSKAFTMLSFHDGTSRTSFRMPALSAIVPDVSQAFGLDEPLTNTDRNQVYVLCGFAGYEGVLGVDVYDGSAHLLTQRPERVDCSSPITLQPLKTQFQSGFVVLSNVSSGLPGWGATIYGAIVNSSSTNGNARVYPFGR